MPINIFSDLLRGPAAYQPKTGWNAFAAVLATVAILAISIFASTFFTVQISNWTGMPTISLPTHSDSKPIAINTGWLLLILAMQIIMVLFTLIACVMFKSRPRQVLALRNPHPRYFVVVPATLIVLASVIIYSSLAALVFPHEVLHDVKPFVDVVNSSDAALLVAVAVIGAPISEEFLFRGFLLSALAKSKLGYIGAALISTIAWTLLHANYSAIGLGALLIIGLVLSWLLWRTGSLWVPIFCHAIYNGSVVLILKLIDLPA